MRLAFVAGRFRKRKPQLRLADEQLEVLVSEGDGLPFHQFCQATQRDEPPLAKLQRDIDQHLAMVFALGTRVGGHLFQMRAQRLAERLQLIHHRQRQLLRDRTAQGSRFSAKFGELEPKCGELGAEIRGIGPNTSFGVGMACPRKWFTAPRPQVDSSKPAWVSCWRAFNRSTRCSVVKDCGRVRFTAP